MLGRALTRIISAQAPWAGPFGAFNHRWLKPLFARMRPVKDFLNGTWLGHPLHAAITDLPVGSLTLMLVFDVVGLESAADVALGVGILAMLAAAVSGSADYTDTDGHPRMVTTVHAALMVVALLFFTASLVLRLGGGADRSMALILGLAGYLVLIAGTYVGGEIVYALGNQVSRHAWRRLGRGEWQPLEVEDIPEGRPVQAKAGQHTLVLVREGETIHALHDVCAHAGGPLSEGSVEDGCIECPWHGSRFELGTGDRRRGPTTYDQPRYEVRRTDGGTFEVQRVS